MFSWICGKTRRDRIMTTLERVGVAPVVEMIVETGLRWSEYAARRPVDLC